MAHRGAVGGLDHLQALGPQRALGQRGLHQFPQCEVGVYASEPPRKMQALPPLMASEAASMVTFGRLSKIVPKTPSRTRICPTLMPRGRPQAGDSANRVGHGGDLFAALGGGRGGGPCRCTETAHVGGETEARHAGIVLARQPGRLRRQSLPGARRATGHCRRRRTGTTAPSPLAVRTLYRHPPSE
jgi:hypothetical protein